MAEILDTSRELLSVGANTREICVEEFWCLPMREFGLSFCGISDATTGFEFVWKKHDFFAILFTFSGLGESMVDGKMVESRPGTAYLLSPGELAAYRAVEGSRWGLAWIGYRPRGHQPPPFQPQRSMVINVDATPVRSAIEGLHSEAIGRADMSLMRSWAELAHLYVRRAALTFHDSQELWNVWRQVDQDLAHHWTLEEMAGLANVSREHLRRLCRQQLLCSPMDHVLHLRMRRAQSLLRTGSAKLSVIAKMVGYSSPFAFSTAFHRAVGSSPADFRKRTHDPKNANSAISP